MRRRRTSSFSTTARLVSSVKGCSLHSLLVDDDDDDDDCASRRDNKNNNDDDDDDDDVLERRKESRWHRTGGTERWTEN
jgi:hypothetical protein